MATQGAPQSLADWFREWQRPLRRFLERRHGGTAADIDDIAQEVFLRLLKYERAELIDCPPAYLFRIAANVSADWAMRASRRMPHQSEWLVELVDALTPEGWVRTTPALWPERGGMDGFFLGRFIRR